MRNSQQRVDPRASGVRSGVVTLHLTPEEHAELCSMLTYVSALLKNAHGSRVPAEVKKSLDLIERVKHPLDEPSHVRDTIPCDEPASSSAPPSRTG
jgi:hypothetical protein